MLAPLVTGLGILLAAHAVTYSLVSLLPDAAVIALGLLGGSASAVEEYWSTRQVLPYSQHLAGVLQGDFGQTIDGVPVVDQVATALLTSGPVLAVSVCLATMFAIALTRPGRGVLKGRSSYAIFDFLNFVPPFLLPFLLAMLIFASTGAGNRTLLQAALLVSVAIPIFGMIASTLIRLQAEEVAGGYAKALRANGVGAQASANGAYLVSIARQLEIFDRAIVVGLAAIMIAEPTLGLAGIGTLTARAVRTADPNLIIGITVAAAAIVVMIGVMSSWLGSAYKAWVGRSPS